MKTGWKSGEPCAGFETDGGSRFIMYGRSDFESMIPGPPDYPKKIDGTTAGTAHGLRRRPRTAI
jgi:hypothetical protein